MKGKKPASANPSKASEGPEATHEPSIGAPVKTETGPKFELDGVAVPAILLEGDEPGATTKTGPGQKFVARPEAAGTLPKTSLPQLPDSYLTGRLFLTATDPQCLYAHWDLSAEQQKHYCDLSTDHHLQLRVHQHSHGGLLVAELRIEPGSRHAFIHIPQTGGQYVADLGYLTVDGPWKSIATSETSVPAFETTTEKQPPQFATLTFTPSARAPAGPLAPPTVSPTTSPQQTSGHAPTVAEVEMLDLLLASDFARRPLEFPLVRSAGVASIGAIHSGEPDGIEPKFESREAESPVEKKFPILVPAPAPEWSPGQEHALAEILSRARPSKVCPASGEIEALVRRQAQGGQVPSPMETVAAPSSGILHELHPSEHRGFWFSVNAELVIYGATEADAMVTIGGRPIRLRPDGTFSYRFALPDGSYRLAISATSSKGDCRQAELDFNRGTAYVGQVSPHHQDPQLKPPGAENLT